MMMWIRFQLRSVFAAESCLFSWAIFPEFGWTQWWNCLRWTHQSWFVLSTTKTLADSSSAVCVSLTSCQVMHVRGLLSQWLGISARVFTILDDRKVVCEQRMVFSMQCSSWM